MTASEFAFLAIGLVLGIASGAALIEVVRARPSAGREVRVTVAPNAIQGRLAATLADPSGPAAPGGPARGGPGDRRWSDDVALTGEPAATGRRVEDRGHDIGASTPARIQTPVRSAAVETDRAATTPERGSSVTFARAPLVAVPMSMEPDPLTTALRAGGTGSPVPVGASAARVGRAAANDGPRGANDGPPGGAAANDGPPGGAAANDAPQATSAGDGTPLEPAPPEGSGTSEPSTASTTPTPDVEPTTPDAAAGPCAEERRIADERCVVAVRAREGAAAAADLLRRTQRTYDEHVTRSEAGAAEADPRAVRAAKEAAQQRFRDARTRAQTRDDVEAGAREWLAEINRINGATREATNAVERDRAAALELAPTLERLAVEADAARIAAERADEACTAARDAVADCDEARTVAAARTASDTTPPGGDDPGHDAIAAVTPDSEEEFAFSTPMHSGAGGDALILRILRGDREALQRAVARLAGDDADARRRWQTLLGGFAEALIARSIEASAFDFPIDHPFWGPFNQSQNRDIAAGLASLGFRFDGFGGWVDDRYPSQRDLSLATGYAGLDPMRIRRWPNEAETRDLLVDVRVAADEYVAGAAGGMTLGELVTLLGRRADSLTELWNEWGTVRPILLEAG